MRKHNTGLAEIVSSGREKNTGNAGKAQYVDLASANGYEISFGTASYPESRAYHTVSVLLPDGRVLVGGGNPMETPGFERNDFRYYSLDYMAGVRPSIVSAPSEIQFGGSHVMTWTGTTPVDEVVLIGLGSMTHSIDQNQRYVQLEVLSSGPGTTTFAGPPTPEIAPGGHSMLFAVDQNQIPSIATIVSVGDVDGKPDHMDNCIDTPNPLQEDTNFPDGYGSICDCDFNGDDTCNAVDAYILFLFTTYSNNNGGAMHPAADLYGVDMNSNGMMDDDIAFRSRFPGHEDGSPIPQAEWDAFMSTKPGPSACTGLGGCP